jgi:hypothetical protein
VVVERFWEHGPEDFWMEFCHPNGDRMTFTAITQLLQQQRVTKDYEDAEQAKRDYGTSFSKCFTYRQGGRILVMSDPTSIAKRYCTLRVANN